MGTDETIRAIRTGVARQDAIAGIKTIKPPSKWSRFVAALGNAIGQAKFGQ